VGDSAVLAGRWPGLTGIEVVRGDDGETALVANRAGGRRAGDRRSGSGGRGRRAPEGVEVVGGPTRVRHRVADRTFTVSAEGFWQVHPAALAAFADALVRGLDPRPGETALDLYSGAGPLTAVLADEVGPTGRVVALESSRRATADARGNLADLPWADPRHGRVDGVTVRCLDVSPDLVVLDPPRAGAGRDVMEAVVDLAPRAIGYVACDPAALARDVATARGRGWLLRSLRAFDAFPMTHHVEAVAVLTPGDAPGR
jgi:tRNA/tmRNA/rRNA uracil-C5-methylase (TrmA/RlmC/RlmD family)